MTLTPTTLRLDLKCGKGAISEGEKCTKGPATKVEPKQRVALKAKGKQLTKPTARKVLVGLGLLTLGAGVGLAVNKERNKRNRETIERLARVIEFGTPTQQVARAEQQQARAASSFARTSDFMRGYGSASQTTTTAVRNPSRRAYSPPKGSTEWKISQVFKAKIKRNTSSSTNPNPDVSAAWAKARIKTSASPYKGDPDVSAAFSPRRDSVWASGFAPDTYDI